MSKKKVNKYFISKSSSQEQRLADALRLLGLSHAASSLTEVNKIMTSTKATYFDFLESLFEIEIFAKEDNRLATQTKKAKFPHLKILEEFDFSFQPSINEQQIRELASCRFINNMENIAFFGQAGVGKTHLSIAIGNAAIQNGMDVRFITLRNLQELIEEKLDNGEKLHRLLAELQKPKLLIIDEIDSFIDKNNEAVQENKNSNTTKSSEDITSDNLSLFISKLITDRHMVGSTIFTANQSFGAWSSLFGSEIRAEAILDRIIGNCTVIEIRGPSYRTKDKLDLYNLSSV